VSHAHRAAQVIYTQPQVDLQHSTAQHGTLCPTLCATLLVWLSLADSKRRLRLLTTPSTGDPQATHPDVHS
jgi:hypothetical protein